MPWKTTKLVFCGIPIRRRSIYMVALIGTIACVPTLSWVLLALGGVFPHGQLIGYAVAAVVALLVALNGWRLILKHHTQLFREEARVIWPGAILLLIAVIEFASYVDNAFLKRGRMDYLVPWSIGGLLLLVFLVKCFQLGSVPRRGDIVRGDSGRRHSRPPLPTSPTEESVADEPAVEEIEDDEGPAPPSEDSPS